MGHNITPLGNHNLNTENVKALAEDISLRLGINIAYGYYGYTDYFKLLGEKGKERQVILGKIVIDKTFKNFTLMDENYQVKQIHDKFGDSIFYNPEYWIYSDGELSSEQTITYEKEKLKRLEYDLRIIAEIDTETLVIYKEHYDNGFSYYSRWWGLCRFFTEIDFEQDYNLEYLMNFRKELRDCTTRLGGNKMYYLDDQSDVLQGVGQGDEGSLSWQELETYVKSKTTDLLLDIPRFFKDKNYQEEFLSKKKDPLSFVDDFSDLK